jgi:hypothetical protein
LSAGDRFNTKQVRTKSSQITTTGNKFMKAGKLLVAVVAGALGVMSLSAQTVVQTVQQFGTAPTPDAWKFSFQISRFLPSNPGDVLVRVDVSLSAHTDYPPFTATASEDGSVAQWNVTETITVKNLKFTADDGFDSDEDPSAVIEAQVASQLAGQSSPLANGTSTTVPGGPIDVSQPTITLTNADDLKRFSGDTGSPKGININIVNKQSRSLVFKPGSGSFNPARKDYHPTTSATLVVTYYVQTASTAATVQVGYAGNTQYLITPAGCTYSSTSK